MNSKDPYGRWEFVYCPTVEDMKKIFPKATWTDEKIEELRKYEMKIPNVMDTSVTSSLAFPLDIITKE